MNIGVNSIVDVLARGVSSISKRFAIDAAMMPDHDERGSRYIDFG